MTPGQEGKIAFAGATDVNYEPPAATQLVLSANSLVGCSYEACSSIKVPDWFCNNRIVDQLL